MHDAARMRMLEHPRHLQQRRQDVLPARAAQLRHVATACVFHGQEHRPAIAHWLIHAQHARMQQPARHLRFMTQHQQCFVGAAAAQMHEFQRHADAG